MKKWVHHNFPEPKMTSSNVFFCLTNSLKAKGVQLTVMHDKEKQKSSRGRGWSQKMFGISSLFFLAK